MTCGLWHLSGLWCVALGMACGLWHLVCHVVSSTRQGMCFVAFGVAYGV